MVFMALATKKHRVNVYTNETEFGVLQNFPKYWPLIVLVFLLASINGLIMSLKLNSAT
jgi:hypothetical protein